MRIVVGPCVRVCALSAIILLTLFASPVAQAQQPQEIAWQHIQAGRFREALAIYAQLAEQAQRRGDAAQYAINVSLKELSSAEVASLGLKTGEVKPA